MELSLVEISNGKAKEIGRGRDNSRTEIKPEGVGGIGRKSQEYGANQIISCGKDWHGRDIYRLYNRDTPAGKILQRLEQLEQFYLESTGSTCSWLEARLDHIKASEEAFKKSVADLKQEVYNLATEPANGNGHDQSN